MAQEQIVGKVLLKGGLDHHVKDGAKELLVTQAGKTVRQVLEEHGVPLDQVQMVVVEGALSQDLDVEVADGKEFKVIPIIEGGA